MCVCLYSYLSLHEISYYQKSNVPLNSLVASTSQLQDHMNGGTGRDIITLQSLVVCQLLSRINELDLIDLDSLLFLQGLLDGDNLVLWFKVESLLAAS